VERIREGEESIYFSLPEENVVKIKLFPRGKVLTGEKEPVTPGPG